jgi:hypothetical protein
MKDEEWESICNRCGKCCYEKLDLGQGKIVYTDVPCEYLDTETNLCMVYQNRHEKVPDCMSLTPDLVRILSWLPKDCAYLAYVRRNDTIAAVRAASNIRKRDLKRKRRK